MSQTRAADSALHAVTGGADDDERRAALRRMRMLALGLLVLAAVVYLLTLGRDGVLGFVNAGAEASMVGAIADWFAVTALFRRPLGLPIPHTALVPERKDLFGRSLQQFVTEYFLTPSVVSERVLAAGVSRRVGQWLSAPEHSRRVVDEVAGVAATALTRVRADDVRSLVADGVLPRLAAEPVAPIAGTFLAEVVDDGAHHGLVDLVLVEAGRWLEGNADTFADVIVERAPWWAPERLNEVVTTRLHRELLDWVAEIHGDPHHHARAALDSLLRQLATDLQHDTATAERAEALKTRMLDHPQLLETGMSLWEVFRRAFVDALEDADGPVRDRAAQALAAYGVSLVGDVEAQGRLDRRAADLAVFVVERYGSELTTVITHTIDRWDGEEAAERIELHVGRDLQFIRINGTVVGGLVGVVIHTVAVLL